MFAVFGVLFALALGGGHHATNHVGFAAPGWLHGQMDSGHKP